jgi:protein translocase SecG subunit
VTLIAAWWLSHVLNLIVLGLGGLLMLIVLIQRGKGGGLAGAFGGAGGSSPFGSRAAFALLGAKGNQRQDCRDRTRRYSDSTRGPDDRARREPWRALARRQGNNWWKPNTVDALAGRTTTACADCYPSSAGPGRGNAHRHRRAGARDDP